ncbi:hypothetical protein B0T18DRAFT_34877 [Schizothecium vesticola]|uniref:Uncharacterized protein n=1 Tax=Schizothecium vesticola TaxID=314040 RepID=A0AA40FAP1_9PEZI|nr:hypothetical protein B0T18DRAFT_34877 [Schizothecium vesticola]
MGCIECLEHYICLLSLSTPTMRPFRGMEPAYIMSTRRKHHQWRIPLCALPQDLSRHGTIDSLRLESRSYVSRRNRQTSTEVGELLEDIGGFRVVIAKLGASGTNGPYTRLRPSKPRPPTVGPPGPFDRPPSTQTPEMRRHWVAKCTLLGRSHPLGSLFHHHTKQPTGDDARRVPYRRPLDAMCLEKVLLFPFGPLGMDAWRVPRKPLWPATKTLSHARPRRPELARKICCYFIPAPGANMEALRSPARLPHILSFKYHIRITDSFWPLHSLNIVPLRTTVSLTCTLG